MISAEQFEAYFERAKQYYPNLHLRLRRHGGIGTVLYNGETGEELSLTQTRQEMYYILYTLCNIASHQERQQKQRQAQRQQTIEV